MLEEELDGRLSYSKHEQSIASIASSGFTQNKHLQNKLKKPIKKTLKIFWKTSTLTLLKTG
jgi:hypothetical protein